MVCSKLGAKYKEEITLLRVSTEDLNALELKNGSLAWLSSTYGEIRVVCKEAEVPQGLFFLPLGDVANKLFSGWSTEESGVPDWKRLEVVLSPHKGQGGDKPAGSGKAVTAETVAGPGERS